MMNGTPLISVGVPTYNRASDLKRCIDSVLAQDYANFELIISDNGSTDGTQSLCEEFYRQDRRIRYIRQPNNNGPGANFKVVRQEAQGEFFMWLGDDDWLGPGYLGQCLNALAAQPDHALVGARAKYFLNDTFLLEEDAINLLEDSPSERVLAYYRQVTSNGIFYGVMRREALVNLEIGNSVAGDWLLIARIATLGKVRTLDNTFINRLRGGASHNAESLVSHHRLPAFVAKNVYLPVTLSVFWDIAWRSPVYKSLGRLARISLATRSAAIVAKRHDVLAWLQKFLASLNRLLARWNNLRAKLILRTRLKRGLQNIRNKGLQNK